MFPVFSHLYFFQLHPEQLLCQRRQNLLQLLHVLLHHRVRVDPGHDAKAMAPVPVQYPDKIHVRSTGLIFALCIVFVYLILSAQYESYILP